MNGYPNKRLNAPYTSPEPLPVKRVDRPASDYLPLSKIEKHEGLFDQLDRVTDDVLRKAKELGYVAEVDQQTVTLLRLGVLWGITDKGE